MSENEHLDRTDFAILDSLQNDGRLSNKELAAAVGLAPSSCLERVRRLRERGVLRGVHADVAPEALGIGVEAILFVRLRRHHRASVTSFRDWALTLNEVVALYNVTGSEDFLVHVVARDLAHLHLVARDAFTERGEVDHLQTCVVFEAVRRRALPNLTARAPGRRQRDGVSARIR
jgi:DNA-binding Lrp family transcriptional regulator